MSEQDWASADSYYEFMGFKDEMLLDRYRVYVDHFKTRSRVLDIGCGTGAFLQLLQQAGIEAKGIDADPGQVERCKNKGLSAEVADGMEFLLGHKGQFSGIFCAHVVEHLTGDQVAHLASASFDALEKGGVAVFVTPNPNALHVHLNEFWRDPTHVRMYSKEALAFLLAGAGFTIETSGDNKRFVGGIGSMWQAAQSGSVITRLLTRFLVQLRSFRGPLGLDQGNELFVVARK